METKGFCLVALIYILFMIGCKGGERRNEAMAADLRCCGLVDPEGVDEALFSWKIQSGKEDVAQSAWEIEITDLENGFGQGSVVWKSGRVISSKQLDIRPENVKLKNGVRYWWRVRFWDQNGIAGGWSRPATFSLGIDPSEWKSEWITALWEEHAPMPYFRKEFMLEKDKAELQRAVVSFCGLGYGDLYMNGELVDSTRVLDPAQTNYEQYALYSTFDVTSRIADGNNCLGVLLGEGWYGQGRVWDAGMKYGNPLFTLQMDLYYKDGKRQTLVSDESWQWYPSPVLSTNVYAGEIYDATKAVDGWCEAGTPAGDWKNAVIAQGIVPVGLHPEMIEPIRLKEKIKAVNMWKDPSGNYIFDFGVNVSGVPQITLEQPKGTHLKMRMGEILRKDGSIEYNTTGTQATGVVQTVEYVCNGKGREVWNPRFCYAGYRYLELSGMASEPALDWIETVVVHTDVERIGSFECSDPQINKLHELAVRTLSNNLYGLLTDCPHREKCGWLGDAHAVAPFANCNFDMDNFWTKYMDDIRSTAKTVEKNTLFHKFYNTQFYFQDKIAGLPYMIAPGRRLCGVASPDWGTAVVQLPWETYLYYGDEDILRHNYEGMKLWVDHVESISLQDSLPVKHIVPFGLGDWCPPEGKLDCPVSITSTAFHYLDASILAKTASLLGHAGDAARYGSLKDTIRTAFIERFYDTENKSFGSQTANIMALNFGLVPAGDEKAVSDAIVADMQERYGGFMHVGIFGLKYLGQALSRFGNEKAAWDVFTKKGENSFAYMWTDADATSLWEILPINAKSRKACVEGDLLCAGGSSLNHPMQGGYDVWFYEDIAGIRPDVSAAGYKVIRFEPTMTAFLDWAKATINTPYGQAESYWKHEKEKLVWKITIPANASGIVALPKEKSITVNGVSLNPSVVEADSGKSLYGFPSGTFEIVF